MFYEKLYTNLFTPFETLDLPSPIRVRGISNLIGVPRLSSLVAVGLR